MEKTMKVQKNLFRETAAEIRIVRAGKDDDRKETRVTFSASSEYEVDRGWGVEVLDHSSEAVKLDRAARGAMPILFNHDMGDPIGMVDRAWIDDGRLMVDGHLFATERARDVEGMMESGLRNVSIGYRILAVEERKDSDKYIVREWAPFEVSIVTVPADPTVGVGRSMEETEVRLFINQPAKAEGAKMSAKDKAPAASAGNNDNDEPKITITGEGERKTPSAIELEKARVRSINNLCKANKIDDAMRDAWVGQGASLEQVSDDILLILEERGKTNPQPASRLGLSRQEQRVFSLSRAIAATAAKDWSKAPFELECSQEIAKRLNRTPDPLRFFVPFEVMQRPVEGKRDLTVATAGAGGYLVGTENMGFIEMLRNRSVAFRMGARRLSGLNGNVTIPRQSAAATAYWLANEATQINESQQTFVQMALTPKNVGAYTEISRQLLLQSSPAAEGIVTDDLAQAVALAVDLAVLEGSGASGQPTGISNTAGIGSVTGTSLAAAGVIEFMTDVAASNVTPMRPGYVTTPGVAGLLMVRPELPTTGTTRLWNGNVWDGSLFNVPAMTSMQLTAASMIFGDWNEAVVGEWGVLEVEVNPFANFQAGIIGVRALYSVDIGIRRPFAFSRSTSIT